MRVDLRSLSFRCRGHADIRASHHKSLEFTRQEEITGRATCVLGVSADTGLAELAGFRGPVAITVEAGASRDEIRAVANPGFVPGESAVIRTSRHGSPETLAVAADKGADRLDRQLVAEVADPATTVRITVTERPAQGRPDPGEMTVVGIPELHPAHIPPEIREALDRVEAVFAADPPAVRAMLGAEGSHPPVRSADADDEIRERLRGDERLACLTVTGPGAPAGETSPAHGGVPRAARAAADTGSATRILPAPPLELLAAVAAAPECAPYTLVAPTPPDRRDRVSALDAAAAAGANLVWAADRLSVPDALGDVGEVAGDGAVRLCVSVTSRQGLLLRGSATEVARQWEELGQPPGETVIVVAGHGLSGAGSGRLDATARALLDEDVPTRTLARALGSLPGHDYRSEYRRILRLKSDRGTGAG